jgi:hypothetical protein
MKREHGIIKIAKSRNISGRFYDRTGNITLGVLAPEEIIERILTHESLHYVLAKHIAVEVGHFLDKICRLDGKGYADLEGFLY